MTRTLKVKVAESRLFHQETGEIPFSAQNPACSNCKLWNNLGPISNETFHVPFNRVGLCTAKRRHAHCDGALGTHQDFWCVLYKEKSDGE